MAKLVNDHLYDTITAVVNLATLVVATWNRNHLRKLTRRSDADEIRRRLYKGRG